MLGLLNISNHNKSLPLVWNCKLHPITILLTRRYSQHFRVTMGAADFVNHMEVPTCQGHAVTSMDQTRDVQIGRVTKPGP